MKLYTICDNSSPDLSNLSNWFAAIWAHSEADALAYAREIYNGDCWEEELKLHVLMEYEDKVHPTSIMQEYDPETLRQAKWMEEGERSCECCDLYPFGIEKYEVCWDCNMCRECALTSDDEDLCDACREGKNEKLQDV